jgi:plastocyanin
MQVRRWRPALVLAAALTVAGAGSAQAATWDVGAGPPLKKPPAGVPESLVADQFFPKTIKVHVGDKIKFGNYGFHTITFLGGTSRPSFLVQANTTVSGSNDPAGNPFWFNGQPNFAFNPTQGGPAGGKTFSGKGLHNSGFPQGNGPPKPYVLKFTKAGTYKYLCLVHPRYMKGVVKVLNRGKRVSTKRKIAKAVKKQIAAAIKEAKRIDKSAGPTGNVIDAGNGQKDGIDDIKYFPANKTIPAGTTLRLQMATRTDEPHTFTFGPQDFLTNLANNGFNGDVIDPSGVYPSDPPGQVTVATGVHGNGFASTGWLDNDSKTTFPSFIDVKFPTPGSYYYLCLVHGPEMSGTITVTG